MCGQMRSTIYLLNHWKHHLLISCAVPLAREVACKRLHKAPRHTANCQIMVVVIHIRSGKKVASHPCQFLVACFTRFFLLFPYILSNIPQLMVLKDGCWQRINFARKEPLSESTADSYCIRSNPRIHNFGSSGRQHNSASHGHHERSTYSKRNCVRRNSTVLFELARSSEQHPECCPQHQSLADNRRGVILSSYLNSWSCICQ